MSGLPIKKIYIDSKFKISGTDSDFRCQLKDSYLMPENAVFKICDVCIPHSWTTIMTGINSKLYLYLSDNSPIGSRPEEGYIINLDERNYTGSELATHLQTQLNHAVASSVITNKTFTVVYNPYNQTISILIGINTTFKLLTEDDIKSKLGGTWTSLSNTPTDYDANDPQDVNTDMLKLNESNSPLYDSNNPYVSKFINLQPIRNLYLSSDLGSYNTCDLKGVSNIIKKIPVTAPWNSMIFDNVAYDDYLDCSRQTIKTLNFRLTDTHGHVVNLNGCYISFSIIFDVISL